MARGEDDMFRWVIGIIVTVALVFSGYSVASIRQLQDVDTRERVNSAAAERAIERVSQDASDKIDKIDQNVQWLIKEQIEMKAWMRRVVEQR